MSLLSAKLRAPLTRPSFRTRATLTIAAVAAISGCASLSDESRHQYLLLRSQPEGARVYVNGRLVGTTPTYVELRRSRRAEVTLKRGSESKTITIDSAYGWKRSFWSNFVLLAYAPVGWAIDLAIGSAWQMEDPAPLAFSDASGPVEKRVPKIAIAPPQSAYLKTSDEAGQFWYKQLVQEKSSAGVLPYEQTLAQFTSRGFDFDRRPDREQEHQIFGQLGVDKVFESEVTETKSGVHLHGYFRDVYTDEKEDARALSIARNRRHSDETASWFEQWKDYYFFVPNTIGVEWATRNLEISRGDTNYMSQPDNASGLGNQMIYLLSAIDVRHLDSPRRMASGRFRFAFTPALRFSSRYVRFPDFQLFGQNKFRYTVIEGGVGPEMGWQSGAHYFYFDCIPMVGWHQLAWNGNSEMRSTTAFSWRAEVGYLYFLTQAFSVRLFAMATTQPSALWDAAAQSISPGTAPLSSATYGSAGLTFSYSFEPERNIQAWTVAGSPTSH